MKDKRPITRLHDFYQYLKENGDVSSLLEFESSCGLARNYITNTLGSSGNNGISSTIVCRIHEKYPQLNIVWLITGEGDMIVSDVVTDEKLREEMEKAEMLLKELRKSIVKIRKMKLFN